MWKRYVALVILLIVGVLFSRLHATGDHHVDEGVAYLLNNVQMARVQLERASNTQVPARRGEAMGAASGALRSAQQIADRLAQDLEPKGYKLADPYTTIRTQTNQLINYCLLLTPDLTAQELARRVDLLSGLEKALAGGVEGKAGAGLVPPVDRKKLVDSWHKYLLSLDPDREGSPGNLKVADPPTPAHVSAATVSGSDLSMNITWDRTFTVFPQPWKQTLLLYSAQPLSLVSWQSTAPNQDGLGQAGAISPVEPIPDDVKKALLDLFKGQLPATWTDPTHLVAVYVLEGLPQTVTLRLAGLTDTTEIYYLQRRIDQYVQATRIK